MQIINYEHKGTQISFEKGSNVMINATERAKLFGRRPNDYLGLPSTKELLNAITGKSGNDENQLVMTVRGGANSGTWLHEDIALDFAQWLNPAFAIWCNNRIKELLTTGVVTATNDDESILRAMQVLQKRVGGSKQQIQIPEVENGY